MSQSAPNTASHPASATEVTAVEATTTVSIILPSALQARTGQRSTVRARGGTVQAVFAALEDEYPGLAFALCEETGRLRPFVNVFVNGRNIRYLRGLETPLAPGAVLHIMPSVAGG